MAAKSLREKMAEDGLPEEIIEDVEEAADEESKDSPEPQVNVRVSRRKQAQEARDAELAELRQRAERAEQTASETRAQHDREVAELRHQQQMLLIQSQQRQQAPVAQGEPLEDQLRKLRRDRDALLAKNDLDGYHEASDKINQLQRTEEIRALRADFEQKTQQVQQQFAAPLAKPAWVTAVEYQYPDVVTHPNGQRIAAYFEGIVPGDFGPEKLHKMMQRARQEIASQAGQNGAGSNGHQNGNGHDQRREMFSGSPSTGGRGRSSGGDGETVKVPKSYMEQAQRFGMSKADAVKAWKESYGNEQ